MTSLLAALQAEYPDAVLVGDKDHAFISRDTTSITLHREGRRVVAVRYRLAIDATAEATTAEEALRMLKEIS